MAKGWISIHRKIQDCEIWIDDEPFDRRSAWIDLLLSANHEDKSMIFDGHKIIVNRGQLITSVRKLSVRWRWGKGRTLNFLKLLEELEMIERDVDSRRTLLTIVNYDNYQGEEGRSGTLTGTLTGTVSGHSQVHSQATNNNIKNDKEINNNIGRFTPPTLEEVRSYCSERNNGVDPQTFIDFYESKGWLIGKNKMKDWKAAVRTWEKRHTDKPKETKTQFHGFEQNKYDFNDLENRLLNL